MPDSTGFGDYTESGQVIPVSFKGRKGGYSHCMFSTIICPSHVRQLAYIDRIRKA